MIYSQISKLLAPVIASIPFKRLKFAFTGKLSEPSADNILFVTHGGLPITRICPLSRIKGFEKRKKVRIDNLHPVILYLIFANIAIFRVNLNSVVFIRLKQ